MNDLKLLVSNEKSLVSSADVGLKSPFELVTFDSNMNLIYVTDHDQIFQIDENLNATPLFDLVEENLSNSASNRLILFQYLTESNNISVINDAGDLNLVNVLSKSVRLFKNKTHLSFFF
jgi:hypothetical protein